MVVGERLVGMGMIKTPSTIYVGPDGSAEWTQPNQAVDVDWLPSSWHLEKSLANIVYPDGECHDTIARLATVLYRGHADYRRLTMIGEAEIVAKLWLDWSPPIHVTGARLHGWLRARNERVLSLVNTFHSDLGERLEATKASARYLVAETRNPTRSNTSPATRTAFVADNEDAVRVRRHSHGPWQTPGDQLRFALACVDEDLAIYILQNRRYVADYVKD